MITLSLSTLQHTWLIDVDGTVLKHNGYKHGSDALLPGVIQFWETIPAEDTIILLSARTEADRTTTLDFIRRAGLRFDMAVFGLPVGERILINDEKPLGLSTAISVNVQRNQGLGDLCISQGAI